MFGDLTFAGGTFSDFFTVSGQVSYSFRKGRTVVVAILPSNGTITTGVEPRTVRSTVEAILPSDGPVTTGVEPRTVRTKVEAIKTISTNPQTGF